MVQLAVRFLAIVWMQRRITMSFTLTAYLYDKKRSIRTGSTLTNTIDTLDMLETVQFIRRKIISVLNSFVEPTGLISTYLLR